MARRIHCGINIDPMNVHGNPSAQEIVELGATWVRFTFKDASTDPHTTGFATYDSGVQAFAQAGIGVLMILDYGTYPGKPAYDAEMASWEQYIAKYAARCRQIAQHYGDSVRAYQIWNEQDLASAGPTYNPTVREEVYARLLKAAYEAVKEGSSATVVMGGLASGDPAYLSRVRAATSDNVLYCDAVGVHPYGQRPTPTWPTSTWGFGVLSDLVRHYHQVAGKPIWVTEIGVQVENVQGEFPGRAFGALNLDLSKEAPCVFWFCWSDGMVSPYGLVRADGQRKAAYSSFQDFARQPFEGETSGGQKVVDYHSHYVLFPAGCGWNWYQASRHYLQKYRVTRGESPDDATKVHGTLGHTITCIDPAPDVVRYLRRVNPNAQLDLVYVDNVGELEVEMDRRADNDLRFGD